jgi:uncharacterized membrane protein
MEFKFNIINFIAYFILVTWALIIVIVPYGIEPDTIKFGDDGYTTYTEHANAIDENITSEFIQGIYNSGDSMCHQKESRTLLINGNQMPYCARCSALFWGIALGVAIVAVARIELKWWWIIGGLAPMGADGGLQLVTNYESNNILRIITGGMAGVVTGLAIGVIVFELTEIMEYERKLKKQRKVEEMAEKKPSKAEFGLDKKLRKPRRGKR